MLPTKCNDFNNRTWNTSRSYFIWWTGKILFRRGILIGEKSRIILSETRNCFFKTFFVTLGFYCPTQASCAGMSTVRNAVFSVQSKLINQFLCVRDIKLCCFLWDKIILSIRLFRTCIWMFVFLRGHIIFQELFSFFFLFL